MQLLQKASINPEDAVEACAADVLDAIPRVMQFLRMASPRPPKRGLSVQQFRALGFLRAYPGASLSEVSTYFGLTLPATSRLVSGLVRRRLVDRTLMPNNRRQLRLTIRPSGVKLLGSAIRAIRSELRQRLNALSPDRLKSISESMHDLSAHLIADNRAQE